MRTKLVIFALFSLFLGVSPVFAEFTFTVPNTTIASDEEVETTVTLSLRGQNSKTYYFEGAFKKGSSNYFGLTWNDYSWVKYTSSNFTTLKLITTDTTGKWNGVVKVKIDKDNSLFSGGGPYTLRMKRFTTGGSYSWADNSIDLTVNSPPSPVPTSTPTPKPTSKPIPVATPTPTPTPTPTREPVFTANPSPTPTSSIPSSAINQAASADQPTTSDQPQPSEFDSPAFAFARRVASSNSRIASVAGTTASADTSASSSAPIIWVGLIFIFAGISLIGYIYLKKNAKIPI